MLLEFRVGNYLSINKQIMFSMQSAGAIKESAEENTFTSGRYNLLKSAAFYGPNASGKSNILSALGFMRSFVINSSKATQVNDEINIQPFFHNVLKEGEPSFFEMVFLIKDLKYRYGFEITRTKVISEWLYNSVKIKEYPLFLRVENKIKTMKGFEEGEKLDSKTRENALFLSVVAQFNGKIAKEIIKWFRSFNVISGIKDNAYGTITIKMLKGEHKEKLLAFIQKADLGIDDIVINESDFIPGKLPENFPFIIKKEYQDKFKQTDISSKKKIFNEIGEVQGTEIFDFESESEGTKKFFNLSGPVFDTLLNGRILVIDEFEARLHPVLSKAIIKLFNSKETNPQNAQLIFATHDVTILSSRLLRRDQIWFVEKDKCGASNIYSLSDYKLPKGKVRNDEAYTANYIKGRYGALPSLGNFNDFAKELLWPKTK